MTALLFWLVYLLLMLCFIGAFLHFNRTQKWITKQTYEYDDGGMAFATVMCIVLYPIAVIVFLFVYLWKNFIPDK